MSDAQLIHDVKPAARSRAQRTSCGDFVGTVASHFRSALDTKSLSATREEQPQIIVNFRGSGDRRARIARGIFLPDGHGGRDAGDFVDVRLFHALQELPRVSGERLDVAALPFGINGVEGQRRFAGAADTRDHSDGVVRNFDGDVPEVMDAGAADADSLLFADLRGWFLS